LITERIEHNPNIELVREEVKEIPRSRDPIIATGPLSSEALTVEIMKLTGSDQLYFYDAIAPSSPPTPRSRDCFSGRALRQTATTYLNCPFDQEQYATFYAALIEAKSVPLQRFEETRCLSHVYQSRKLPERGVDTLALRSDETGRTV